MKMKILLENFKKYLKEEPSPDVQKHFDADTSEFYLQNRKANQAHLNGLLPKSPKGPSEDWYWYIKHMLMYLHEFDEKPWFRYDSSWQRTIDAMKPLPKGNKYLGQMIMKWANEDMQIEPRLDYTNYYELAREMGRGQCEGDLCGQTSDLKHVLSWSDPEFDTKENPVHTDEERAQDYKRWQERYATRRKAQGEVKLGEPTADDEDPWVEPKYPQSIEYPPMDIDPEKDPDEK